MTIYLRTMKVLTPQITQLAMIMQRSLLKIFLLVCIGPFLQAQQGSSVSVTGALLPPQSLDLSVYGTDRTQDLFFSATLNDPTLAAVQARLHLSVEQNGKVIYQTDPNFLPTPINLQQFQQVQLDGGLLQEYLRPENLTGARGTGMGATEIPEGFNQICVQVFEFNGNVPISNKFCLQANFQLNQAPQIVFPEFNTQIPYPETQNLTFSWSPMHLGSGNTPPAVEYEFELVQLPDGYFNANDAFEGALRIYSTTTFMPSLIYTQAEPQLEADKVYAWRVRAFSSSHPTSKLFQNDGYSEISTLILYDDVPLDNRIGLINNPAPRACSVAKTSYGPIKELSGAPIALSAGDFVKLGYFNLQILQASSDATGYSGTGTVNFPMLNSKVNVRFSGLQVNSDFRVFQAKEVTAAVDEAFQLNREQLQPENVPNAINRQYIAQLKTYFEAGYGQDKLTSTLDVDEPLTLNLPLGLDQQEQPLIAVIGIDFSPQSAYLHLAAWQDQDQGSPIRFAATAVPATPYGMLNGAHLVPLIPSAHIIRKYNISEVLELIYTLNTDSRMSCNCAGYEQLDLAEKVRVSPGLIRENITGDPLVLDVQKQKLEPGTYLGDLKPLPNFTVNSLPGFVFKPRSASLDLQQQARLKLDKGSTYNYKAPQKNTWRGLAMEDVALELPAKYNVTGAQNRITLDRGILFVDEQEVAYGQFYSQDLMNLDQGAIGKWAYSVDHLGVEIREGHTEGLAFTGQVKVPIFTEPFTYQASEQVSESREINLPIVVQAERRKMGLWKAEMNVHESSSINAQLKTINRKRKLYPQGDFSGTLSISRTTKEFENELLADVAEVKQNLMDALGIDRFDFTLTGVELQHLRLEPFATAKNKYRLKDAQLQDAKMIMAGKEFRVINAEVLYESEMEGKEERLGLMLEILYGENRVGMTFWGQENGSEFTYQGLDVEILYLHCKCLNGEGPCTSAVDEKAGEGNGDFSGNSTLTLSRDGSLVSNDALQVERSKTKMQDLLETLQLTFNQEGGTIDSPSDAAARIIIPFLNNKELIAASDGSAQVEAWYQRHISGRDGKLLSEDLFQRVGKLESAEQLPLDISEHLGLLEIADDRLPNAEHMRLLITYYDPTRMELTLLYKIDGEGGKSRYYRFVSDPIAVAENFTCLGERRLFLQSDIVLQTPQNDVIELQSSNRWNDFQSFAFINCDGFQAFKIAGAFKAFFDKDDENDSRIKLITKTDQLVEGTTFGFTLNTAELANPTHSLTDFIAPISKWNGTELNKAWHFSTNTARQLIFRPSALWDQAAEDNLIDYNAYIDFSDNSNITDVAQDHGWTSTTYPTATGTDNFKGLVFKNIQFEVINLKRNGSDRLTPEIEDVVYSFDNGLYATYQGTNLVKEEDEAELSSWNYTLDKLSFEMEGNYLLARTGVQVEGMIHIPIFDKAPPSNLTSVKYSSGFLPYSGKILYDNQVILEMGVAKTEIHRKIFHSAFVPGLGLRLNTTSRLKFYYEIDAGDFNAQAKFDGIGMITISKELLDKVDIDKDAIPDGLDFTFPYFAFQDLAINEGAGYCGTPFRGIKTLDFGTWGILPQLTVSEEEEDKLNGAEDLQPSFQTVDLKIETPSFICDEGDKYKFILAATLSFKKDEEVPDAPSMNSKSPPSGTPAATNAYEHWADQFPADIPPPIGVPTTYGQNQGQSKGRKNRRTSNFTAAGQLNFVFKSKDDELKFEQLDLGCISLNAEYGPVAFSGGVNILKDGSTDGQSLFGNGFKAYVQADVGPVSGKMVGQLGTVTQRINNSDAKLKSEIKENAKFDYFFFDVEVLYDKGVVITPNKPVAAIYGAYGGIRYNMQEEPYPFKQEVSTKANNNDLCAVPGDYLTAGQGITGVSYEPYKGKYGININLIAGTAPPSKVFVADVGVDVQIKEADNAIGLSFDAVTIRGFGSFLYDELSSRRTNNVAALKADLSYNFTDEILSGTFGYQAKLPASSPFFVAPKNLVKAEDVDKLMDGKTPANAFENAGDLWNEGRFEIDFANKNWDLKFGSWYDPSVGLAPPSRLEYLTHRFKVDPVQLDLEAYFQAGMNVDPLPPLTTLNPSYKGSSSGILKRAPGLYRSGTGLVMGARLLYKKSVDIYGLRGELEAKLGFDASLRKAGNCGDIGFEGWYAQGQAYAYLGAGLYLDYDFWFDSGTIKVFHLKASTAVQMFTPNPSYFEGQVHIEYSVLGGLLEDDFFYHMKLGEKPDCLPEVQNDERELVRSMTIFADGYPEGEKVSVFSDGEIRTNVSMTQALVIPKYSKDLEFEDYYYYRPKINYIQLWKLSGNGGAEMEQMPIEYQIDKSGKNIQIAFLKLLEDNTHYKIKYEFEFQEKRGDGEYKDMSDEFRESGEFAFESGTLPDVIVDEMLSETAPGKNQRYWTKGYSFPKLRFIEKLDGVSAQYFPESIQISENAATATPQTTYEVEYLIEVMEYPAGNENNPIQHFVEVDAYPKNNEDYTVEKLVYQPVANTAYKLPKLERSEGGLREILFAGFNQLNLQAQSLCRLRLLRRPILESNDVVASSRAEEEEQFKKKNEIRTIVDGNTKILYEYHFAIGTKPLVEKLWENLPAFAPSLKARDDLRTGLEFEPRDYVSNWEDFKIKDEYFYWEAPKSTTPEGFDWFDLNRLKRNMKIDYNHVGITTFMGLNGKATGGYINEVRDFYDYLADNEETYAEEIFKPNFPYERLVDGSRRNFDFHIPLRNNEEPDQAFLLSSSEIQRRSVQDLDELLVGRDFKKDNTYESDVLDNPPKYTLLYQDIRSRLFLVQDAIYRLFELKNQRAQLTAPSSKWRLTPYVPLDLNRDRTIDGPSTMKGYENNYHGALDMVFPNYTYWRSMNQGDDYDPYNIRTKNILIYPDHGLDLNFGLEERPKNYEDDALRDDLVWGHSSTWDKDQNKILLNFNVFYPRIKYIQFDVNADGVLDALWVLDRAKALIRKNVSGNLELKSIPLEELGPSSSTLGRIAYEFPALSHLTTDATAIKICLVDEQGEKYALDLEDQKEVFTAHGNVVNLRVPQQTPIPTTVQNLGVRGTLALSAYDWGGPSVSHEGADAANNGNASARRNEEIDFSVDEFGEVYLSESQIDWINYTVNYAPSAKRSQSDQGVPYLVRFKYDIPVPYELSLTLDGQELGTFDLKPKGQVATAFKNITIPPSLKEGGIKQLQLSWKPKRTTSDPVKLYNIEFIENLPLPETEDFWFEMNPKLDPNPVEPKEINGSLGLAPEPLELKFEIKDAGCWIFNRTSGKYLSAAYNNGDYSIAEVERANLSADDEAGLWQLLPLTDSIQGGFLIKSVRGDQFLYKDLNSDQQREIILKDLTTFGDPYVFFLKAVDIALYTEGAIPGQLRVRDIKAPYTFNKVVNPPNSTDLRITDLLSKDLPEHIYITKEQGGASQPVAIWSNKLERLAYFKEGTAKPDTIYEEFRLDVDILDRSVSLIPLLSPDSLTTKTFDLSQWLDEELSVFLVDDRTGMWKGKIGGSANGSLIPEPKLGLRENFPDILLPAFPATVMEIPGRVPYNSPDWGGWGISRLESTSIAEVDFQRYTVNVEEPGQYLMHVRYKRTGSTLPFRFYVNQEVESTQNLPPTEGKLLDYPIGVYFQEAGTQTIDLEIIAEQPNSKIEAISFENDYLPEFLTDRYYSIQSHLSEDFLDINGSAMVSSDGGEDGKAEFRFKEQKGYFLMIEKGTGKILSDDLRLSTPPSGDVSTEYQWILIPRKSVGDDYFLIKNKNRTGYLKIEDPESVSPRLAYSDGLEITDAEIFKLEATDFYPSDPDSPEDNLTLVGQAEIGEDMIFEITGVKESRPPRYVFIINKNQDALLDDPEYEAFKHIYPAAFWNRDIRSTTLLYENVIEDLRDYRTPYPLDIAKASVDMTKFSSLDRRDKFHADQIYNSRVLGQSNSYVEVVLVNDENEVYSATVEINPGREEVRFRSRGKDYLEVIKKRNLYKYMPFRGKFHELPGSIYFAEYDVGGKDFSYKDNDPSESPEGYRAEEEVDFTAQYTAEEVPSAMAQSVVGRVAVTKVGYNEELEYSVHLNKEGSYEMTVTYKSPSKDHAMVLKHPGGQVDITLKRTTGDEIGSVLVPIFFQQVAREKIKLVSQGNTDDLELIKMEFVEIESEFELDEALQDGFFVIEEPGRQRKLQEGNAGSVLFPASGSGESNALGQVWAINIVGTSEVDQREKYQIMNLASGKCLTANANGVFSNECGGHRAEQQAFFITPLKEENSFHIEAVNSDGGGTFWGVSPISEGRAKISPKARGDDASPISLIVSSNFRAPQDIDSETPYYLYQKQETDYRLLAENSDLSSGEPEVPYFKTTQETRQFRRIYIVKEAAGIYGIYTNDQYGQPFGLAFLGEEYLAFSPQPSDPWEVFARGEGADAHLLIRHLLTGRFLYIQSDGRIRGGPANTVPDFAEQHRFYLTEDASKLQKETEATEEPTVTLLKDVVPGKAYFLVMPYGYCLKFPTTGSHELIFYERQGRPRKNWDEHNYFYRFEKQALSDRYIMSIAWDLPNENGIIYDDDDGFGRQDRGINDEDLLWQITPTQSEDGGVLISYKGKYLGLKQAGTNHPRYSSYLFYVQFVDIEEATPFYLVAAYE